MLLILHEGHQSVDKNRRRAHASIYWPGIVREIEEAVVKRCHQCLTNLPVNSKEPLEQPPIPTRPWEKLSVDLFSLDGNECLITTDYFSFFTEVNDLKKNSTTPLVIKEIQKTFACFGTPVEVVSDGGSQFKCRAFEDFSQEWGFKHTVLSPTHAQSNGKAEAPVKNVKRQLKKCGSMNKDDFWKGMLAIRNTPLSCGKSPVQLLFGRVLHDFLPRVPDPKEDFLTPTTREKILHAKGKEKRYYDQHTSVLHPLKLGSCVAIRSRKNKDWSPLGTVIKIRPNCTFAILIHY